MQPDPASKVPVTVYVPVERRYRKETKVEWWTVEVLKALRFSIDDFRPLALQKETETFLGCVYLKRWDFDVAQVDEASRVVIAHPYSVAASKFGPLEDALVALGWKQCADPTAEVAHAA